MAETYSVYVLFSEKFLRTYTGQTKNLDERLKKHNLGLVISTKSFKPWRVIYTEKYETRSEAMKREKWFKSGRGRKFIKTLIASR